VCSSDLGWFHHEYTNLNSGVYIARRECLIELLESAVKYVTDNDLSGKERNQIARRGGVIPEFPLGCGSDQQIIRFIYPKFAEYLRLDYANRLALR